jgi:pseudouridine-5'-phosphate glycosidase
LTHRVESADEVARIARAHWSLGGGGILVAAPVPTEAAIDIVELELAVDQALSEAEASGVTGPATTPVVLGALADATDGRSVPTNLALAEHNAAVAAAIAVALAP